MAAQSINFFQPGTDAAMQQQQIDRQRKMAEMLMQKSQTPAQGQMVSGHYVAPSWLSGVAQVLQGAGANYANRQADEKQVALGEALRARNADEVKGFMGAMAGSPAQKIQPLTPNDDEGNPMPVAEKAAVAPDRNRALAMALQSQNPMLQNVGGKMIDQQMSEESIKAGLAAAGITAPSAGGAPGAAGAPGGAAPAGGIPGVDPRAMALALSGNPQLNKVGSMIQEAAKPINVTEGGTLFNPGTGAPMFIAPKTEPGIGIRNGVASPVPGYADSKGQLERSIANARQGAESENTMVTVKMPDGSDRQMTRSQFLNLSNGGTAAPQGGVAPPPGRGATGPGYAGGSAAAAATGQAEILTGELGKSQQALAQAQQRGDAEGVSRAQSDIAGIQRELGRLPGGGRAPGIAGQTPADAKYASTRAEAFAKRAGEIQSAASSAGATLRNLDSLETLFKDPNIAKGGAAEGISTLKNYAASTGMDIKGLGAEQAVQAITNKMALDSRSTAEGGGMPGAMSDADRNFLAAQQPGLSKTPEGRATIIANARKLAQRQVEVARMMQKYEQDHGKIDAGFDRQLQEYADKNQMFGGQKAAGSNIDSLLKKYQ